MGAVLALLASVSWGTSDFLGGALARRLNPVAVMASSQLLALVGLAVVAWATGELGASGYVTWGVLGGLCGAVALGSFYTALSSGTMGVVAPVAACGIVIPVGLSLLRGEAPGALQMVGIAVAAAGVILASGPEGGGSRARRPLILAAVAASGFGLVLVVVAEGSEYSVVMTLLTMRAVNVLLAWPFVLVKVRRSERPIGRDVPLLAVVGACDTGANGLYAVATTSSLVSVSSVLASLYPAVTALLAWRVLHEHLRPVQVAGVGATLVGVGLIASGV